MLAGEVGNNEPRQADTDSRMQFLGNKALGKEEPIQLSNMSVGQTIVRGYQTNPREELSRGGDDSRGQFPFRPTYKLEKQILHQLTQRSQGKHFSHFQDKTRSNTVLNQEERAALERQLFGGDSASHQL